MGKVDHNRVMDEGNVLGLKGRFHDYVHVPFISIVDKPTQMRYEFIIRAYFLINASRRSIKFEVLC